MSKMEIIALVVTIISLLCFCIVFTILFSHYCKASSEEVLSGKKDIELLDSEFLEKKKKKKESKTRKIVKKVVSYVVLSVLVVFLGLSIYSKANNDVMLFGNSALLTVASGSMSYKNEENTYLDFNSLDDQFQTYDVIQIQKVKEEDLKLYDVIAFKNDENKIIIHRIIKIESDVLGVKYTTRGDANNLSDEFNPRFENIVGRYTGRRVPIVGIFVLFLQSYSGMVTVVALLYCIYMFDKNYSKLKKNCDDRLNLLLDIIKDPLNVKEFKTTYVQYIYYQGNIYEFQDGVFKKKTDGENNDNTLYVVSNEDEQIKVKAQDVLENVEKELTENEQEKTLEEIKNKMKE